MDFSRRSFLGGALTLVAGTTVPSAAFASVPTVYGDGVHDDWAGLQALMDSKPFRAVGNGPMVLRRDNGQAIIRGGCFRLSRTLEVSGRAQIMQTYFEADDSLVGPVLSCAGDGSIIYGVHVKSGANTTYGYRFY